jgi:DNA-binding protein HU-beta
VRIRTLREFEPCAPRFAAFFALDGLGIWAFFASAGGVSAKPIEPESVSAEAHTRGTRVPRKAIGHPGRSRKETDRPYEDRQMSKQDLIDAVAEKCELTKDKAKLAVDAMIDQITAAMKNGGDVRIPDFGTFKVAKRKAREGRNPATGATIKIPASNVPKFTPAKKLKDVLN